MPVGWIRAYDEELEQFGFSDGDHRERDARAAFREAFRTLAWSDTVDLPGGLSSDEWTRVVAGVQEGFVRTAHLVELAYVDRHATTDFKTQISFERRAPDGGTQTVRVDLLWGDCVQIMRRSGTTCHARARGVFGSVPTAHLMSAPLLEIYFIDVGQGDGALVRTPDSRHLLVDGGLERAKQQTGKNAADFVDWKFYVDYGHFEIVLESMTALHSDNDHYGGLHDLVRIGSVAGDELDCRRTRVGTLHHPGLSRWEGRSGAQPPHRDGLGPQVEDDRGRPLFVRLLGDRDDACSALWITPRTSSRDHGTGSFAMSCSIATIRLSCAWA